VFDPPVSVVRPPWSPARARVILVAPTGDPTVQQALLTVSDVPTFDAARRYRLDCEHGSSWALVLPGRSGAGDSVALVVLGARHGRENGCRCAEAMPRPVADPGWSRLTA
jgi:hypothetical protein